MSANVVTVHINPRSTQSAHRFYGGYRTSVDRFGLTP